MDGALENRTMRNWANEGRMNDFDELWPPGRNTRGPFKSGNKSAGGWCRRSGCGSGGRPHGQASRAGTVGSDVAVSVELS